MNFMKGYLCPAISSLMFCAAVIAQPPVSSAESAADQAAKHSEAVAAKLVSAPRAGDMETLTKMLDHGVGINSRTPEGLTALPGGSGPIPAAFPCAFCSLRM